MATVLEPQTPQGDDYRSDDSLAEGPLQKQRDSLGGDVERTPTKNASSVFHKSIMLIAVVAPPVGMAVAIMLLWTVGWMGWLYLGMLLGGCFLTLLGITVSYHRLLSHRAFDCVGPVRFFFTALGAMAIEGSPIRWCGVHRRHHQYSDQEGDPHSPHTHDGGLWNTITGFFYAHMGWLFTEYWSDADTKRYVPDLYRDRSANFISNYYYLFVILSIGIPMAIGGLATMSWHGALLGLIWGGLARVFLTHHITWSVNSVCHVFGSRDFDADDYSTNNAVCALLASGEGWHNNHHAFPSSACFGLKWYQVDVGWTVIRTLKALGLAWNVKVPSAAAIAEKEAEKAAQKETKETVAA
ncbi:MAG: fatty acid desaturase [Planctomycetales bacterium]|nr:fatty acid desaturase [Planctomycetales bacterium]